MTGKELEKFSDEYLNKILEEGKVFLGETITAYKEFTNRSYAVFAFSSAIISFCINKIIEGGMSDNVVPYIGVLAAALVAIIKLWKNLLPQNLAHLGTNPKHLAIPYFEGENQLKKYTIAKILAVQKGIDINTAENAQRVKRFEASIFWLGAGLVIGLVLFLLVRVNI